MRVSVILGHPSPKSFNHAIAMAACDALRARGHKVFFHDLYAEEFDPILPAAEISRKARLPKLVKEHCDEIRKAEGLVLVHPNWWGEPPAILKGWVDRVLRPGVAYDFPPGPEGAAGLPIELLKTKVALVLNTSDTPAEREERDLKDPLQTIWKNTLAFCGIKNYHRKMYRVIVTSAPQQRAAWLEDVRTLITRLF